MPYLRVRCKHCGAAVTNAKSRVLRGVGRCCLPCSNKITKSATSPETLAELLASAHPTPDYPDCLVADSLVVHEPQYGPLIWRGTAGGLSARWLLFGRPPGANLRWSSSCGNPACIRREHMVPSHPRPSAVAKAHKKKAEKSATVKWEPKERKLPNKPAKKLIRPVYRCASCRELHDTKKGEHTVLGYVCSGCLNTMS